MARTITFQGRCGCRASRLSRDTSTSCHRTPGAAARDFRSPITPVAITPAVSMSFSATVQSSSSRRASESKRGGPSAQGPVVRSFRPTSTNRAAWPSATLPRLLPQGGGRQLSAAEISQTRGFRMVSMIAGRFRCSFLLVTIVLSLTIGPGCGDGKPSVDTSLNEATVTGVVSANGVPATGGTILFNPSNSGRIVPTRTAEIGRGWQVHASRRIQEITRLRTVARWPRKIGCRSQEGLRQCPVWRKQYRFRRVGSRRQNSGDRLLKRRSAQKALGTSHG